jgi:hypothetical protein
MQQDNKRKKIKNYAVLIGVEQAGPTKVPAK